MTQDETSSKEVGSLEKDQYSILASYVEYLDRTKWTIFGFYLVIVGLLANVLNELREYLRFEDWDNHNNWIVLGIGIMGILLTMATMRFIYRRQCYFQNRLAKLKRLESSLYKKREIRIKVWTTPSPKKTFKKNGKVKNRNRIVLWLEGPKANIWLNGSLWVSLVLWISLIIVWIAYIYPHLPK